MRSVGARAEASRDWRSRNCRLYAQSLAEQLRANETLRSELLPHYDANSTRRARKRRALLVHASECIASLR